MPSLSQLLADVRAGRRPMALIASLPANDPDLARAALEGGADVIKVHINLEHRASHTHFGSLAEERPALEVITRLAAGRPCGIVPGNDPTRLDAEELRALPELGFDFLSLYLRDAPAGLLPPSTVLERMLALSSEDALELAGGLDRVDMQVCELSIMAKETYGQPLTALDLARFALVRARTRLPLVAPTQHFFTPAALADLAGAGVEAVMLGAIVAGKTPATWREQFSLFRREAERLYSQR